MKDLESLIASFGLNVFLNSFFQLTGLVLGDKPFIRLFLLIYEISIIALVFQLGALRYCKETGESLDQYFETEGGLLICFTIGCLILSGFAGMMVGGEFKIRIGDFSG